MTPDPSQGQPSPNRPPHVEVSHTPPDSEVTLPPADPYLAEIFTLACNPSPEEATALGELIDTLSDSPSSKADARMSYLGDRLANNLTAVSAPIALKGLSSRSLSFTGSFLATLARKEFFRPASGTPPLTQGVEYFQLRAAIASVAVSPEKMFRERDWNTRRNEIEKLSYLPITILRHSAGEEIDVIAVEALKNACPSPSLNRKAAELLSLRESSHSNRVLSEDTVVRLLPILSDCLRDDVTRWLVSSTVDKWLAKGFHAAGEAEQEIKKRAIDECKDFLAGRFVQPPQGAPQTFDFLPLLRHFKDRDSDSVLWELSAHSDTGAALLAEACLENSPERQSATLTQHLKTPVSPEATLESLRLFGYQLSEQADLQLATYLEGYATQMWNRRDDPDYGRSRFESEQLTLAESLRRRLYAEPITSPLLAAIFAPRESEEPGLTFLALLVLQQSAKSSDVPPLCMYQHAPTLQRVAELISLAKRCDQPLAGKLSEVFFFDTPARYGFEVDIEEVE